MGKTTKKQLQELRMDHEASKLRRELLAMEQEEFETRRAQYHDRLESNFVAQLVDYRDYLLPKTGFQSRIEDRQYGKLAPVFYNETDLAAIRSAGRLLANCNLSGVTILERLTDYVIRTGFVYKMRPVEKEDENAKGLAKIANAVIDEFIEKNAWNNDLDRELFSRQRAEGERFLGLWHEPGGITHARVIEPDCVRQPARPHVVEDWTGTENGGDWSFGVHTKRGDTAAVMGYYVQWSPDGQDWDYLPGGNFAFQSSERVWVDHVKINVPRTAKRGISDFFPVDEFLKLGHKIVKRTGQGSALQASIAWIKEVVSGTTQQQAVNQALSNPDATFQRMKASGYTEDVPVVDYQGGSILTPAPGTQYKAGPLGAGTAVPSFINSYESIMRLVGTRWAMREDMVTGSAKNNNYASILVAGDPFVFSCESKQAAEVASHKRILWKVLEFAWMDGKFGSISFEMLKQLVCLHVDAPQIAVRDRDKETDRREKLFKNGILSAPDWAAQEDLDYEDQVQKGAKVQIPIVAAKPGKQATNADPNAVDQEDATDENALESLLQKVWQEYP